MSVGHVDGSGGSLGIFVGVDNSFRGEFDLSREAPGKAFLSAAHVLAPPNVSVSRDDYIHSPRELGRRPTALTRCAKLKNFDEVRKSSRIDTSHPRINIGDLALAVILENTQVHNVVPTPMRIATGWRAGGLSPLRQLLTARDLKMKCAREEPVFKFGSRTGFTHGALHPNVTETVSLELDDGTPMFYRNVHAVNWAAREQPFSDGGDSGSVIYDADMNIFGLITGSRGERTYFYHLDEAYLLSLGARLGE